MPQAFAGPRATQGLIKHISSPPSQSTVLGVPHTHIKAARVGPGLRQGAGAVDGLLQEVRQPALQYIPRQTLLQGPGG